MKDFEIRCDESHLEKNNTLYGKFTLGPFLPGQGTTFGNALRRSLLTELAGLAVTAFEIVGVMHEFSTLPGLRESVLDLSLNLKQVVLTGILPYSTPPIGFLKIRGPAIIKAIDLKLPAGVYCASPDQYIATLASNGILNLKFVISIGKGYSTQPYSLYRSLSKVKLQATRSSHFENTDIYNDYLRFFEQREGSRAKSFDVKKMEKTISTTSPSMSDRSLIKNHESEFDINQRGLGVENDQAHSQFFTSAATYGENVTGTTSNSNLDETKGYYQSIQSEMQSKEFFSNGIQTQIFQRVHPHQVLPIDAIFTPVSRVNFLTQINDRYETARENIVLEIWTNGSIHPKRALEEATLSLVQNFDSLLKKIQQTSSFYKGLRYWNYLQSSTLPYSDAQSKQFRHSDLRNNKSSDPFDKKRVFLHGYNKKTSVPSPLSVSYPVPNSITTLQTQEESGQQAPFKMQGKKSLDGDNQPTPETFAVEKNRGNHASIDSPLLPANGSVAALEGMQSKRGYVEQNAFSEEIGGDLEKGSTLYQAISNLDLGNFHFSLQTFILLKEAKIHTLSQLLTYLSSKNNSIDSLHQLLSRARQTQRSQGIPTTLVKKEQSSKSKDSGFEKVKSQVNRIENNFFLNEKVVDELNNVIHQLS